jgi:16S rRNA (cytosine967-C5)-methyltransferase
MYKERQKSKEASPARVEALKVLIRVERDGAFAAPLLASERVESLSPEDRRLVYELVLGVLRWRGELDYIINVTTERAAEKLDLAVRASLWLGLYQLRHLGRVPQHAAVSESVMLVKNSRHWRAAPLVNAALRAATRDDFEIPDERVRDPLNRMSIALSHPRWLLARWAAAFGDEETRALALADNEHPPVAFRVNPLRAPSLGRVLEELGGAGVEVRESAVAPGGYVVVSGALSPSLRPVKQGWVHLQDEASQLVAALVAARAGDRVLDIGAAPGGKTTQMAAAMGNSGTIVAVDLHPARLATLRETAARLAARCVRPVAADATRDLPLAAGETFDRVLIDAPCSGTGTLRRHPEIKWRLKDYDVARFPGLQRELLERGAARLRPGGRLVYSTCSLEPEEDEAVVRGFLEAHPDFATERPDAPAPFLTGEGFLRTFPHRDGSDGFFAAVLARG